MSKMKKIRELAEKVKKALTPKVWLGLYGIGIAICTLLGAIRGETFYLQVGSVKATGWIAGLVIGLTLPVWLVLIGVILLFIGVVLLLVVLALTACVLVYTVPRPLLIAFLITLLCILIIRLVKRGKVESQTDA
jgi:hypothetical protein